MILPSSFGTSSGSYNVGTTPSNPSTPLITCSGYLFVYSSVGNLFNLIFSASVTNAAEVSCPFVNCHPIYSLINSKSPYLPIDLGLTHPCLGSPD